MKGSRVWPWPLPLQLPSLALVVLRAFAHKHQVNLKAESVMIMNAVLPCASRPPSSKHRMTPPAAVRLLSEVRMPGLVSRPQAARSRRTEHGSKARNSRYSLTTWPAEVTWVRVCHSLHLALVSGGQGGGPVDHLIIQYSAMQNGVLLCPVFAIVIVMTWQNTSNCTCVNG